MQVKAKLETKGNLTKVEIDRETFSKINGQKPEVSYTEARTKTGERVKVFVVDGVTLYSFYKKPTAEEMEKGKMTIDGKDQPVYGTTTFYMKSADITDAIHVPYEVIEDIG